MAQQNTTQPVDLSIYINKLIEWIKIQDKKSTPNNLEETRKLYKFLTNDTPMGFIEACHYHIHSFLSIKKDEKNIRKILREIAQSILPIVERHIEKGNEDIRKAFDDIYWKLVKLLAFRSAEHLALVFDKYNGKAEKHWTKKSNAKHKGQLCEFDKDNYNSGIKSSRGGFYHGTRMILNGDCKLLTVKMPVSYGKSFMFSVLICFKFGVNPQSRVVFVTESQILKRKMTRRVKLCLQSPAFAEVFPFFGQHNESDHTMFETCAVKDGILNFTWASDDSFLAFTRQEGANGVRSDLLVLDDLTKGVGDMNKPYVHSEIVEVFDGVWNERADGEENNFIIAGGTCWADYDLLNVIEKRVLDEQGVITDSKNQYTTISKDGYNVFVSVPALDFETNLSTFPQKVTTSKLRHDRDNKLSSHEWWARCQQRPLTPDGVEFIWENLATYDNIPDEGVYVAICDPAHGSKGTNSKLTMHIYKHIGDTIYFVNCVYGKYDIEEKMYDIARMIVQYSCKKFAFEENTIRSFGKKAFKDVFTELGFAIEQVPFSTSGESGSTKKTKIFEERYMIKNNIKYPKKNVWALSSEMGQNMSDHTNYTPNTGDTRKQSIDSTDVHRMAVSTFLKGSQKATARAVEGLRDIF